MKAVIPVKASSSRVPNKNFRPFHGDRSLFDLAAERLLAHFDPADVYVSCEDPAKEPLAERWGFNFMPRERYLADNLTPFADVVRTICAQVPGEEDIVWAQVCDPLFDEHGACIETWGKVRAGHDSLVVVHPVRGYFLDRDFRPLGFGFGYWHVPSQQLPPMYRYGFTLSILTRESLARVGYPVGERPYWYVGSEETVDIDTESDFALAQVIYARSRATADAGA
jgi:CMP-N-acetylneuraminic acid synthetase